MEALPTWVWLLFILLQICQDIVQNSPQVFYELSLDETSQMEVWKTTTFLTPVHNFPLIPLAFVCCLWNLLFPSEQCKMFWVSPWVACCLNFLLVLSMVGASQWGAYSTFNLTDLYQSSCGVSASWCALLVFQHFQPYRSLSITLSSHSAHCPWA